MRLLNDVKQRKKKQKDKVLEHKLANLPFDRFKKSFR